MDVQNETAVSLKITFSRLEDEMESNPPMVYFLASY